MKKKILIGIIAVLVVIVIAATAITLINKNNAVPAEPTTEPNATEPTTNQNTPSEFFSMMDELDELPKLYIEGNIDGMASKDDKRSVTVNFEAGEHSFQGFAELKLQGNTALGFKKKNYTIKLFQDAEHIDKLKVNVGWGEESRYCLKANWVDKTHARNIVSANLVTEMQKKYGVLDNAPTNCAIDGFPMEVYSNGEFLGIYTFNIPKHEWLFAMDDTNPNHIVMESTNWNQTNLFFAMPDYTSWEAEVGVADGETMEKFKRVFDFVLNSTDEEFKEHFHEYLDLDACLNYNVMAEVAFLGDNVGKNMLMVTYDGQVWYPVLYDMDASWGQWWDGKGHCDPRKDMLRMSDNYLFKRIRENFGKELADRYFELREDILSEENILGKFNAFQKEIPEDLFHQERRRWGGSIPGFGISQIQGYLDAMLPRLDADYSELRAQNAG